MILFGGFQESVTNGTTKFFNDVHIYDFQSRVWSELKYGKLARLPPPRSACNLAVMSSSSSSSSLCAGEEALFMYGGYSKVKMLHARGNTPLPVRVRPRSCIRRK